MIPNCLYKLYRYAAVLSIQLVSTFLWILYRHSKIIRLSCLYRQVDRPEGSNIMTQATTPRKSNKLTSRRWIQEANITFTTHGKTVYFFVWTDEQWLRLHNARKSLIREFGANFDELLIFVKTEYCGHHILKPTPERPRKVPARQH